jgi:hypothetical protein
MIRRRRRTREIPFSFDSFLDVVANVVGIIIRLILVVWVGARSYNTLSVIGGKPTSGRSKIEPAAPADPLQAEVENRRRELDEAQRQLLEQLRRLGEMSDGEKDVERQLALLADNRQSLSRERAALGKERAAKESVSLSMAELRDRQRKLLTEIEEMRKLPPAGHLLKYRTPVGRPLRADEFFFECRRGRVAFIDVPALVASAQRDLDEKSRLLRTQWQVADVTPPVGSFRLRYTIARETEASESAGAHGSLTANETFRYGLVAWTAEPVAPVRGETLENALTERSQFRQIVDRLDPEQAAITFWVYPDSFALYRQLREYLYDRNLIVAGRPLPEGVPIASSRQGTRSLGQ